MKTQDLIKALTPDYKVFKLAIEHSQNGTLNKNAIIINFFSKISNTENSHVLYKAYKHFVRDCCLLAKERNKKVYEVVNDISVNL
jgi:hypothetical protein